MADSNQVPLVSRLRQVQNDGTALLSNSAPRQSEVDAWAMRLRSEMQTVYGDEPSTINYFPSTAFDDPRLGPREQIAERLVQLDRFIKELNLIPEATVRPLRGKKIFIGHGRSLQWLKLKDFISERLKLPCEEFNSDPTPGVHTTERLESMLSHAGMAFLVMTAEERHADGTLHARPNVIHEIGLFQGRLGSRRSIIVIEDECVEFSNILGLTTIRFPSGDISARFEEVRRVLEREGLL